MISKGLVDEEMVAETKILEFSVGNRIECCGYFGTIKYIGPVEGYSGTWLGIDWDDPDRGKHNGTVNGLHYFDTRFPKSGSFVRKEKINFGKSLIKSIKARYGYKESEISAKINEQKLLKFQQDINAPFLQFVGFDKVADKQSDFQSLMVISVISENVNSIGKPLELYNLCPNLQEIDISKNLLTSWKDIFDICSQLKHLYWINLSENILSLPDNYTSYKFPNISVLICGYMYLAWEDVMKISVVFPNVEELRVPYNNITDLTTPEYHNFKKLSYIDLGGNNIHYWLEILKLSVIPTINHMTLDGTKLDSIYFPGNNFPNLNILNVSNNLISEWKSIAELNKLSNLEHLRIVRNPVLELESTETCKQIIITKIKNLKTLNGSIVQKDERLGAEYDYLKKYTLEWIKVKNTPQREDFLAEHNRYLELIEMYGLPEESELITQPNIIRSTLVKLNIQYGVKVITKKLPYTILVQKLLPMVQKMFKLASTPKLQYISTSSPDIRIDLDDEMKELGYYSVQDSDTIIVQV